MEQKIKTGDIIRIPLWNGFGFGYARYIDLTRIPNTSMPSLIDVYAYWTESIDFETEKLKQSDFLIQPILVAGINPVIKEGRWIIVEHLAFNTSEYELPHFKAHEPRWDVEKNARDWFFVENCETNRRVKSLYENVKHLESYAGVGTGNIEIKITMQIMKMKGIKIEDYFDLSNETFKYQYELAQKSPLLSEIPKALYGKAKF
jgi:hypothetical protein